MHFDAHTYELPGTIQARSWQRAAARPNRLPPRASRGSFLKITGVRGFAFGALPMGSLAANGTAATAKPAGLNERAGGPDRQALARAAVQAGLNRPG